MKLLFVIDSLGSGGAQRQMVNLAVSLKQRRHQVDVFYYSQGEFFSDPLHKMEIPIYFIEKKTRYSTNIILALRQQIFEGRYDIVLSFLNTPNFYSIIASHLTLRARPRVIVSERFGDIPGFVPRTEKVVRQFYRLTDHVIVNSYHQANNFKVNYPWLQNRISTIYNGYDLKKFSPIKNSSKKFDCLKILVIASISRYKNGICLVEALKISRNQYNLKPYVNWVGQQILSGERLLYRQEMDQRIQELKLGNQWNWLGQSKDIVKLLRTHDLLVHSSFVEGLPNVVCEALACGRPVIVSNTLDHPYLVQDGVSGYLFDWKNPADLAKVIWQFSQLSHQERLTMGQKGREFAEKNLSLERFTCEYEQLFQSVMSKS